MKKLFLTICFLFAIGNLSSIYAQDVEWIEFPCSGISDDDYWRGVAIGSAENIEDAKRIAMQNLIKHFHKHVHPLCIAKVKNNSNYSERIAIIWSEADIAGIPLKPIITCEKPIQTSDGMYEMHIGAELSKLDYQHDLQQLKNGLCQKSLVDSVLFTINYSKDQEQEQLYQEEDFQDEYLNADLTISKAPDLLTIMATIKIPRHIFTNQWILLTLDSNITLEQIVKNCLLWHFEEINSHHALTDKKKYYYHILQQAIIRG